MTPPDANLQRMIDDIANALQGALLLSAKLTTALRTDVHDAGQLYEAVARACEAMRQYRTNEGGH
jgi:hypothetical protein